MSQTKKVLPHKQALKEDPKALHILQQPTETPADALAHASLSPTVQAAMTLVMCNKELGDIAINTLVDDLQKQCDLASKGELGRAEALLTAQAHTLDAIFNNLARRAALNFGEYVNAAEMYLRLALKAQGQCRATLETLAMSKNPQPVAFVRQANIAHGPQQVNNGLAQPREASRAGKTENQQNKLLEVPSGERLDTRAEGVAGGADSQMETLEAVHRSKDTNR